METYLREQHLSSWKNLSELAEMLRTQTTGNPPPGSGNPTAAPEANLANMVAARQNLAELTTTMGRFVNEGIGPVSNAMVTFTQELRTKAIDALKAMNIADYMTPEQRARYEATTGAGKLVRGVGEGKSDALGKFEEQFEEKKEEVRQGIKSKIQGAKEVLKEVMEGAAGAAESVNQRLKKSFEDLGDILNNFNRNIPNFPASRMSFNSSSMTRLLEDYRTASGPNTNYNSSLLDTVYRPDANDNNQVQRTSSQDSTNVPENMVRDQLAAYGTMISQQAELIVLLQRSVGIQDKTLRATYNT